MRKPSAAGGAWSGRPLKKSPSRRAHDHLHRRKRNKSAAAPSADLVAAWPDPHSAIQLQLGHSVGGRGHYLLQLLLPVVQGFGQNRRGDRFSRGAPAPYSRTAADRLGPPIGAPQQTHPRFHYRPGYAPELNPVEYIWAYWKQHALPNVCSKDYWSLNEAARRTLKRMRRRPRLITAFWEQAELSF